ncbi:transpeptidase family protein [Flavobacteriales bacterium]|jgi:cell division protein FtsI (penicillin-binding protein 3)|nr:transpeptidase family protein [Flavobacteriales bacterium]
MIKKVKKTNNRITGLYLAIVFIAFGVFAKIVKVQQFSVAINTSSQPRYFTVEAPRGNITADDGALLAISMPLYDVRLDMSVMNKALFNSGIIELSDLLAQLFKDKTPTEYELFLRNAKQAKKNKYILLQNKVTHNELNALKKMPILEMGQNKGGLIAEQRPNREKPFGLLAQRTVGVLRGVNPVGIERAYNQTLSGVYGIHLKRKIAKGIWVPQDAEGNRLPRAGNNVVTTINTDMQDVAEKALENTLINNNADWGCVVLMEVATGEVKVIANLKKQADGSVRENFNYAMAKHVSPGSTFKLASVIAGLEDGFFKVEDSVRTYGGKFSFYDRVMMDSKLGVYDNITIKNAFINSSNVGISRIIFDNYKSNPTAFTDRIYKMGLSTPLELELPFPNNLKSPVPNKGGWSGVTLPWMSIGYEMQLTPIHMLAFYNAIANQGTMVKPIFTSAISSDGKIIKKHSTQVINPAICSKVTIEAVIPLLIGVVEEGTAKNIRTNNYLIAGKTGTTVINFNNRVEGEEKEYQASFAGFFPADNPRYSCIVVINNPRENGHYGGSVAAPIFKELADKVYASDMSIHKALQQSDEVVSLPKVMQGHVEDANNVLANFDINRIVTHEPWMVASTTKTEVSLEVRRIERDLRNGNMPDLRGMGIQDAIYLLESYGLVVEITGSGSVQSQSISKGNKFIKGSLIKLELA